MKLGVLLIPWSNKSCLENKRIHRGNGLYQSVQVVLTWETLTKSEKKKKSSKNSQECGKLLISSFIKCSRGLLNKCSRGTWHPPTLTVTKCSWFKKKQTKKSWLWKSSGLNSTEYSPQWAHDPGNTKKENTKSFKNPPGTKTASTPRYSLS